MTQPTDPSGFTAAQASDPSTAPQLLADIAYRRPDLRAAVAANPAAYPGLVEWLASLKDPQVDAALATRAATAAPAQQPPAAPAPTQQAAPAAAGWGAQTPEAAAAAPQQPYGAAPAQGSAPAYGAPGAEQPAFAGAPGPGAAGYGAPGAPYGAPGFEGQPMTPITPKRSRAGVWIGLGAAAVVLVGGGAFAANKLWFSKVGGAGTPSESVTRFADGLSHRDMVAVYGVTSPTEVSYLQDASKMFTSYFKDVDGFKDLASDIDPKDYADVLTFTSKGLTVDADELDAVTSRVTVTAGSFTLDVDADKVVELAKKYASTAGEISSAFASEDGGEELKFGAEEEKEVRDSIASTFPLTATVSGGSTHYESASGDESGDLKAAVSVISVKESGSWFVSPLLTLTDYALRDADGDEGSRGSLVGVEDVKGAKTAEEAGTALITGTVEALKKGDIASIGNLLPYAERRVVAFAASAIPADAGASVKEAMANLETPTATFSERRKDGDHAWLELTALKATYSQNGVSASVSFADGCLTIPGMADKICMADSPGFAALGIDQLSLVAVHEKGGWFASPTLSMADGYGLVASKIVALAKDGKLTSEWFQENFGGLTSLFSSAMGSASSDMLSGLEGLDGAGSDDGAGTTDPGTVDPGTTDPGTDATDPGTDDSAGSGDSAANTALVTAELKKAAPAAKAYLADNRDSFYFSVEDLADYGYVAPEDTVWLMAVTADGKKGTFCLAGTDLATYMASVSIDQTGKVYDNVSCS